jgi:PPOX class probable F420-dependent enzyme
VSAARGLTPAGLAFLAERHLATLTTMRADGSPHVVPVGFTWDDTTGLARVITSGPSRKAANAEARPWAVLCQLDGRRWLTLEGPVTVRRDPAGVADAEARYAQRYRVPRINPRRVCLEIAVRRLLGSPELLDRSPT